MTGQKFAILSKATDVSSSPDVAIAYQDAFEALVVQHLKENNINQQWKVTEERKKYTFVPLANKELQAGGQGMVQPGNAVHAISGTNPYPVEKEEYGKYFAIHDVKTGYYWYIELTDVDTKVTYAEKKWGGKDCPEPGEKYLWYLDNLGE